jgi:hypothetical protein
MNDPIIFMSLIIFLLILMSFIHMTKPSLICSGQRETYKAHCIIYLVEHYPGIASSNCHEIMCSNIGGGQVEVVIEINIEGVGRHVSFVLKVADYEKDQIKVAKIDDRQIINFKNAALQL